MGHLVKPSLFKTTPPNQFHAIAQLGVAAFTINQNGGIENAQLLDTTNADRPWITSDGPHVWISYHDAGKSALIHIQRSDDNGVTWHRVGDPIVGQDGATADATFNNDQGPIVADPITHNLYDIYAAGEPGIQKATTTTHNNIYVARSTDMGKSWTTSLVYHAPLFTALNNFFPSLAVDPTSGKLYATWSDGKDVSFATSSDQGVTWSSPPTVVNIEPANTAIFPWVAAYNGKVDVVYYATTPSVSSNGGLIGDSSTVWKVYLAQTTDNGATFTQSLVSNSPNHVGPVSTLGILSPPGTRNLLDLFQVAIDPITGRAGVVYTDDTITKDPSGNPLPQVVLAYETDPPASTSLLAAATPRSSVVTTDQPTPAQLAVLASDLPLLIPTAGIADQLATPSMELAIPSVLTKKRR